jgi:hypothetical protein
MELFLVSFIMSSLLIYNAKSSLTKGALEKLAAVSTLRSSVRLDDTDDQSTAHVNELPDFIWVVRDFSLLKTATAETRLREFMTASNGSHAARVSDDESDDGSSQTRTAIHQISDLKKVIAI